MLLAILSDIHANLEALEVVLEDVARQAPDRIVCLGDFVGYGASPNECIARLRPLIHGAVAGNHDHAAIGRLELGEFNQSAATAAGWTSAALTAEHRDYLLSLGYDLRWPGMRLVHASPAEPQRWHYVLSPADAEYEMASYPEPVCFIGHSHFPGAFEQRAGAVRYTRAPEIALDAEARYLVNVGSVGQPRDGDPRAAYALYDDVGRWMHHVRIEYDIARAAQRILDAGLPPFLAQRLAWGE